MSAGSSCVPRSSCRRSARSRSAPSEASWRARAPGGSGRACGDGDARQAHRKRAPQVRDGAAMELARARLADAHSLAGLAQRQSLGVVAREHLALARRKVPQRALDAAAQVLVVELLVDAVAIR